MTEIDALDPVPTTVTLTTGTVLELERLKARQFFKLLRILTHGAVSGLTDLFKINPEDDPADFGAKLLSVMLLSIPDSEEETIDFLQSMCHPVGLVVGRNLNKNDTEHNNELWRVMGTDLFNPELDDVVTLVEAIIAREADDIQALGKRLAAMFALAKKTGQLAPSSRNRTSPTVNSSAVSAEPSTFSQPNTAGPTPSSPTSPSADYDSASRPSANDDSSLVGSVNTG